MSEQVEKLTSEEVENTLLYFDAFLRAYQGGNMFIGLPGQYFTPDIVNQVIKTVNNNPQKPQTAESIQAALDNTNNAEQILRNYAVYFEINNIFYKRLINFNANLPAWNLTFDCINIEDDSDFKSEQFKKDLKVIDNFCSRYNAKRENRIILNQILRQGVYFGVLRDEADIYSFQELPPDYCKITGDSNVGKLFDFDFSYFTANNGANIDMYPKVFKKLLRKVYTQEDGNYRPKSKYDTRHNSFGDWIEVSPRDNFFCFSLDNGIATLIPYYSSLFPDMYLQPMMRELEKNKAMISAQKILVNLLETYDNAKSGTVANQYKITPTDVGGFMSLVKKALNGVVKSVALPAKDSKVVDFEVEANNRYTNYQRNIAANSVASSASMLTENKLNSFESELALNIDENFVKGMYGQFEAFLNYYINRRTTKFKFNFKFHDTNSKLDRNKRNEQFKDFASIGLVDFNLYARATDQNVFEAQRALKFTKAMGIEKDLISLLSLNNQSKESGRPQDDDSNNDNTMASKERGSNDLAQE